MRKTWIVLAVIAIIVILIIAIPKKNADESLQTQTDTVTDTSGTGSASGTAGTGTKTGTSTTGTTTAPKPIPANTLVVITPEEGQIFKVGSTMNIAWDSSVDLSGKNTKVIIKILKDGKEITTLTEQGGWNADPKKFSWKIQDMSLWGEQGFSVSVTTTGLAKNLSARSGTFTIAKPI